MANHAWRWVLAFVLWTVLLWTSRIRNVWESEGIDTSGRWVRTGIAVLFLALAVALAAGLGRWRARSPRRSDHAMVVVAVVWTVGFWLVRGIGIIVDDHDARFTAIHTALMVASIGVAGLAARFTGSFSAPGGLRAVAGE